MGFQLAEVSGTAVRGHVDVGADHHTPRGVVHGVLYCSVIESAASIGASLTVQEHGRFALGVDNNTDFVRGTTGGRLDVVSRSGRAAPSSSGTCSSPAPRTASSSPAARCGCRACR